MSNSGRWFDPEHVATWDNNPHRANPTRAEQLDIMRAIAVAKCEAGDQVIDLACGTGHVIELMMDATPEMTVTAVDYSSVVLDQAKIRLQQYGDRVSYVEHDLNKPIVPKLAADRFAIAISVQSFHHFDDAQRERQLADVHALLRPGGLFLVQDRFALEAVNLMAEYQAMWQRLERIHDLEIPDERPPPAIGEPGERAASLAWFLGTLKILGFQAAILHLHGTRAVIAARKHP